VFESVGCTCNLPASIALTALSENTSVFRNRIWESFAAKNRGKCCLRQIASADCLHRRRKGWIASATAFIDRIDGGCGNGWGFLDKNLTLCKNLTP